MSWTLKDRETFIEFYERKYGVLLKENDELLSVLHFIYEKTNLTESQVIRTHELINLLEVKVKDLKGHIQPKQIQLDAEAAWKWQMGIILRVVIIGIIGLSTAALSFHIGLGWGNIKKATTLIKSQPYQKYLFEEMKTDNQGYSYIELKKFKDNPVEYWKDYCPINDSTVRVYVGLTK